MKALHGFKFLIVTAIAAVAFAVALGTTVGNAGAQEALPEQSPLITTCNLAYQAGQIQGVTVTNCRKVSEVIEGNTALVTVKVKVPGQGWFLVSAGLQRAVWSQSTFVIAPAG